MQLSMYQASVPTFTQLLSALSSNLDKAAAHVAAKKIDPVAILGARLFPDMFPFLRQVQSTCDHAKNGAARLAGQEPPRFEDKEASFDELKARIAKTLDFLKGIAPAAIDGSEERDVKFMSSGRERVMKGADHLRYYVLPNFFFHNTTAYNILRHNGVELGKRDYLNP